MLGPSRHRKLSRAEIVAKHQARAVTKEKECKIAFRKVRKALDPNPRHQVRCELPLLASAEMVLCETSAWLN
jgi:hypothetical protein